ncbi:MAG: DUF5777 family beta-barrel protein [Candidatus Zixiibacteriota bacterium]|jgi:hypothetical protein
MRRIVVAACVPALAAAAFAFERDMIDLDVPTAVEARDGVLDIRHRFYGAVDEDPAGTLLGITEGANVGLGFRYVIWSTLEVEPTFTTFQREYTLGLNYSRPVGDILTVGGNVDFFSYDLPELEDRRQNFFYALELAGTPLLGIVTPAVNIGYDAYEERVGAGVAVAVGFDRKGILKHVAFIGEYYPVIDADEGRTGPEDSFAGGVELQTYGHHFTFLVGNNPQIGTRRLMLGAPGNELYFGFNIYRRIEF